MTGTGSGTGLGHGSHTHGTGLTGGDSGIGSGTTGSGHTGSTTGSSGLVDKAERYVEGSEKHHRGDGHPEDILHPGPHVTQTAKALDPHLN